MQEELAIAPPVGKDPIDDISNYATFYCNERLLPWVTGNEFRAVGGHSFHPGLGRSGAEQSLLPPGLGKTSPGFDPNSGSLLSKEPLDDRPPMAPRIAAQ